MNKQTKKGKAERKKANGKADVESFTFVIQSICCRTAEWKLSAHRELFLKLLKCQYICAAYLCLNAETRKKNCFDIVDNE